MQPFVVDKEGTVRFQENSIVRSLLDASRKLGFGLNELSASRFPQADWEQFYQLIGYSLSGYHELSQVSDESALAATKEAQKIAPRVSGCRDEGGVIHCGVGVEEGRSRGRVVKMGDGLRRREASRKMECTIFAQGFQSSVVGPGREARCSVFLPFGLELEAIGFSDESLRSFSRARLTVNGKRPEYCVEEFTILPLVPASVNEGPTRTPFVLKSGDVLEVASTNSSGGDARLSCTLTGFVKEVP
jgi:hypothetical protein